MHKEGNKVRLNSVSSAYSTKFVFNDIENIEIEADNGVLISA